MRTEHLDNKINELETLRSRGELTYMGGEMLSEFNEIKQALTIPVVVVPKGTLPNNCKACGRTIEEMGKMTSMCGVSACPNY